GVRRRRRRRHRRPGRHAPERLAPAARTGAAPHVRRTRPGAHALVEPAPGSGNEPVSTLAVLDVQEVRLRAATAEPGPFHLAAAGSSFHGERPRARGTRLSAGLVAPTASPRCSSL